jgi:hypothetical protein
VQRYHLCSIYCIAFGGSSHPRGEASRKKAKPRKTPARNLRFCMSVSLTCLHVFVDTLGTDPPTTLVADFATRSGMSNQFAFIRVMTPTIAGIITEMMPTRLRTTAIMSSHQNTHKISFHIPQNLTTFLNCSQADV